MWSPAVKIKYYFHVHDLNYSFKLAYFVKLWCKALKIYTPSLIPDYVINLRFLLLAFTDITAQTDFQSAWWQGILAMGNKLGHLHFKLQNFIKWDFRSISWYSYGSQLAIYVRQRLLATHSHIQWSMLVNNSFLLTVEARRSCCEWCGFHSTALISYLFCLASFLRALGSPILSERSRLTTASHFCLHVLCMCLLSETNLTLDVDRFA